MTTERTNNKYKKNQSQRKQFHQCEMPPVRKQFGIL